MIKVLPSVLKKACQYPPASYVKKDGEL